MTVPTVTAAEVPEDAYLLDVREPDEWAAGHVPGSAYVRMATLPSRLDEVPKDRDVVVVCRTGARSGQVCAYLGQLGWTNVRNLAGGLEAWEAAGRPLESDDALPPRVV